MKQTIYLFNPGRMSRRDNTLHFAFVDEAGKPTGRQKVLPIEQVERLMVFGSLDANSALFNFLGKQRISVHFFDYYEHYTGSFMPREYLLAGKMQVEQTKTYLHKQRRLHLARQLVEGASYNMLQNMRYYQRRGREMDELIAAVETYRAGIEGVGDVAELMGLEGNCRQAYYQSFEHIITDFPMAGRHRQPPSNEVNALISFGNMLCYTLALDMIYHTQLNPTISFLHEPGARRYSLALDLAEIFKPIFVDRLIFKLLNRHMLKADDFERKLNGCFLAEKGKQLFSREFDARLAETIQHRSLGRKVSYRTLVKLECHKMAKYILRMEERYQPFKIWW